MGNVSSFLFIFGFLCDLIFIIVGGSSKESEPKNINYLYIKRMDSILTNKYFCIAILIALAILLYLYSQNRSCEIEQMRTVDLTPLAQELSSAPWTDDVSDGSDYGRVGTKFDKMADAYTKAKLKKNGFKITGNVPRIDVEFNRLQNSDNSSNTSDSSGSDSNSSNSASPTKKSRVRKQYRLPRPLNDRPDLSQCVPCPPCSRHSKKRKTNPAINKQKKLK